MGYNACKIDCNQYGGRYREQLRHIDRNRPIVKDSIAQSIPLIKVYSMEGADLQWWEGRGLGMGCKEPEAFMQHKAFMFTDEGSLFGKSGTGFELMNPACPTSSLAAAPEQSPDALKKKQKL